MEKPSQKYILVQDRVVPSVEKNILSRGPWTKQSPILVVSLGQGELFEALPEDEQPNDSLKIALVGIDHKFLRLKCGMEYVVRLTEEDANLLLAISSCGERYQTYVDSARRDFGRKIGPESKVYVTMRGASKKLPGVVWYKGELPSCSGTMFGVELIVSIIKLIRFCI